MYNLLFLDSGAFSASRKESPIKIDEYIAFIKEHEKDIHIYANLDVIGNWKATWENQRIMEEAGLSPLPVHHLEDPMSCLDRCMDYDYFALGGVAGGASSGDREHFFNTCWDIICDKDGMPQSKVHGFGMASPKYIYMYPWYSIDSSSWVAYGRYGIVIMPKMKNDRYDFSVSPAKIFVTDRSPKKEDDGKHFDTLSPMEKEYFLYYLEYCGIPFGDENEEGVSNSNFWRDLCNCLFFTSMCKFTKEWPWAWQREKKPATLF